MVYLLLILGFFLLIKGADFFVEGSSRIAHALKVSPLFIGLTIVSFGTSSPEATVSIIAALEGTAGVALGNVIGSNIFNITLVIGLTAMLYPLTVESETIKKEIPFTLLASLLLFVLISDVALQQGNENLITRSDGIVILLFFSIFLYYIFEIARKGKQNMTNQVEEHSPWFKNILITVGGLAAIIFGGELVVRNATQIALSFGMSDTLVGLTIVSIGTSLPELMTSIAAALKKQMEIAIGNIVGSNIFNILFVLGLTSVISPLAVENKIYVDVLIMIFFTILLLIFSRSHYEVRRLEGGILVSFYVIYIVFILIRN